MSPVVYRSRIVQILDDRRGRSLSPTRTTLNSTAVPSSDGIGPSAATCGSDALARGAGTGRNLEHDLRIQTADVVQSRVHLLGEGGIASWRPEDPSSRTSPARCLARGFSCSRRCCAWIASGLFVKSMSVVSASLSRTPTLRTPDQDHAQIPTVRHGWRLLARAIDSGFSLIRSSPPRVGILPSADLHHMLTTYGV